MALPQCPRTSRLFVETLNTLAACVRDLGVLAEDAISLVRVGVRLPALAVLHPLAEEECVLFAGLPHELSVRVVGLEYDS